MVVEQFLDGQLPQREAHGAHSAHILLAVLYEFWDKFVIVGRHATLPHKVIASAVFLHIRTGKATDILKRPRRAVGAGLCCGAIKLLKIEVDLKHIPEDQTLKRGVMRAYLTFVV